MIIKFLYVFWITFFIIINIIFVISVIYVCSVFSVYLIILSLVKHMKTQLVEELIFLGKSKWQLKWKSKLLLLQVILINFNINKHAFAGLGNLEINIKVRNAYYVYFIIHGTVYYSLTVDGINSESASRFITISACHT